MTKIARFILWICKIFTRNEIESIIAGLVAILQERDPFVKPKDYIHEQYPNYRRFYVDPQPPLNAPPKIEPESPDWETLLTKRKEEGFIIKPVKRRSTSPEVPSTALCPRCGAPHDYLYFNDGKQRTQLKCKICSCLFQVEKQRERGLKTVFLCPHCHKALYRWKEHKEYTAYKCGNDNCPAYLKALRELNDREKYMRKRKSSQFKLRYQYRQYHFQPNQLHHSSPEKPKVDLSRIHKSSNILGLILAFYISFAIPARKSAAILKHIFNVNVSYQTVLNYAEAAAYHCHRFNLKEKGAIDNETAADECYIKVAGKYAYTFFAISSKNRKITAYLVDWKRDTLPATIALSEAFRTAEIDQKISIITDGNPSYTAAVHFLNQARDGVNPIRKYTVIGLQNLDSESETYRHFKQLIERLNRTYKYHIRHAHGFKNMNGAIALTVLFVTHYNFLRAHHALNHKVPIALPQITSVPLLQNKWLKLLSLALDA